MAIAWEKVGRAIADVAPALGGLMGGPAGAVAGSLIASTLGTAADPEAVLAKMKSDPDTLLKIKQLEQDEKDAIRSWQLETLKAELADVQSARQAHAGHWMPSAITIVLAAMVGTLSVYLCLESVPDGNKDILVYLVGQLTGLLTGAVTYWIGTSRSSYNKDQALLQK